MTGRSAGAFFRHRTFVSILSSRTRRAGWRGTISRRRVSGCGLRLRRPRTASERRAGATTRSRWVGPQDGWDLRHCYQSRPGAMQYLRWDASVLGQGWHGCQGKDESDGEELQHQGHWQTSVGACRPGCRSSSASSIIPRAAARHASKTGWWYSQKGRGYLGKDRRGGERVPSDPILGFPAWVARRDGREGQWLPPLTRPVLCECADPCGYS